MSNCFSYQELEKSGRTVGGVSCAEVFQRMRSEGVEICGLGVANLPLLSLLPSLGIRIRTVRDKHPTEAAVTATRAVGARLLTGEGYLSEPLTGVILRTPSLRPDDPALLAARSRGALVLTEVALTLALTPATVFAVTGSDGKTTTAMMTAKILEASGIRTFIGGNIGTPLLSQLTEMRPGDAAVFELSSFQLSDLDPPRGRVAITNITENHLDWHTDMGEYIAAKARILGEGPAVLSGDCPETCALRRPGDLLFSLGDPPAEGAVFTLRDGTVLREEEPLFRADSLRLVGRHHLANAMTAAALTGGTAPREAIASALAAFRGAPHRTEYLGVFRGVTCYDSSIDTTPSRTATTLAAFRERPAVILGGRDKNLSPLPLADALLRYAKAAVVMGECKEKFTEAVRSRDLSGRFPLCQAADLAEAVRLGLRLAGEGGILLLSPAATAFDSFSDYRDRGRAFAAILREEENKGV